MLSLVAPLAASPASSALTEGSSKDPDRPTDVSLLFNGLDGINIWSKYLCRERRDIYEGKRELRLADLHLPANTHLLLYGPSYMRQFEQLLLTAHCIGNPNSPNECKMDPTNSRPGPGGETCGFSDYPCHHLAYDVATWFLGQNRSLTTVTNHAPLQLPPDSRLRPSNFDRIGETLYAKGKTHAWIMEPHDVNWWQNFFDIGHPRHNLADEQRMARLEAALAAGQSETLSWSRQFWQTIKRDFGHAKLLNLRSWLEESPVAAPGAEGIERCELQQKLPENTVYCEPDMAAAAPGSAHGPHICAFVQDYSSNSGVTTGPLVELARELVSEYI